ncbi:MAG: asparaginase domain-containing protein [Campylobacterota bacterium]|nr:asparaginase domain-containing protein [Campylobacterota bacterium]
MVRNDKNIIIINTGGTFNKIYNQLNGNLEIYKKNSAIKQILISSKIKDVKLDGLIYKDSLDITNKDRDKLVNYINNSKYNKVLIVHGTDTINLTALYLAHKIKDKQILLTGAMVPFSIDPIEATSNLMMGYGFLKNCTKNNVYISMHGFVKKYNKIKKNRELGVFE